MKPLLPFLVGLLFFTSFTWAQRTVQGTITSTSDSSPMIGASIVLKGTQKGTISDLDGKYSLEVPNGPGVLIISVIGFKTTELAFDSESVLNIALDEDVQLINEIVVTSFGVSKEKKTISYAATEVKGADLLSTNQPNVISALQGRIPGAIITNSSGAPGAGTNIILRGINSLSSGANNQPLIVIDGMLMSNETVSGNVLPSAGSNASGSAEQFSQTNRLADLNPNDIESVNVLKGAAASALYGSQGSNGVIVITTKKGVAGNAKINFSTSYTSDHLAKTPDIQSDYGDGLAGYRRFAPNTVFWQFGPINNGTQPFYNNHKNFFVPGKRLDNALTISGGNDKVTYLTSLGYLDQDGIIPTTDFKRLTGRMRTSYDANNWLKISGTVAYTNSGGSKPNGGDKSVYSALAFFSPSFDINNYINPDGSEIDYSNGVIDNPRWLAEFSTFKDNVNRYSTQLAADAKLLSWLKLRYQVGLDGYTDFRKRIAPPSSDVGAQVQGFVVEEQIKSRLISSDILLTGTKKINDDFGITLLLGQSITDNNFQRVNTRGERLGVANFYSLLNATTFFASRADAANRLVGVFGDLNLEYKNYLFINASARNDWTSTLPAGSRSFFYPSIGVSLLFSELLGLPEKTLSYGKIRASYAESGKGTDPYQVGLYYDFLTPFGSTSQTRISTSVSDAALRPEHTGEIEVGTEVRFFKNRLGFDFTYFTRNSKDLIQPLPVSNTTGFARYVTNVGKIQNSGIELAVNTTPIQSKNFRWNVDFTYTKIQGKINKITDSIQQFDLFDANAYNSTPISYRYKAGGRVGDLYGYKFTRHTNGELLIAANGYPSVNTAAGYVLVGNALPDFILTANSGIQYKGFGLSGLFEWRSGGDMVDLSQRNSIRNGILQSTVRRNELVVFKGVTADGTANTRAVEINEATLYRDFNRYNSASEVLLQDGSWLRLRNVSLSYMLPTSVLRNAPIQHITVRATGNNLFVNTPFRGYDPEGNQFGASSNIYGFTGLVTPALKNYSIGLDIQFK